MQRKSRCIAFAAVLIFCLTAVIPAAFAASTAQLAKPDSIDAWMGAPTEIHLPWAPAWKPEADTDFSAWTVQTVRQEGPDIAWGPVTEDGVTGTVTLPGTPGARATYYYTVQLMVGSDKMGNSVGFQFDAFAPQIKALAGVQPVTGATADVQMVWADEAKPAPGTDFAKWTVTSSGENAPEITWGPLTAEGAAGKLPVPADAVNGTSYEYSVEVRSGDQTVGNPAQLTAVVERDDTAFVPIDPVTALPGTTVSVDLQWLAPYKPEENADLSGLSVASQSEDENAPEISWSNPTAEGAAGTIRIPADASGKTYTYVVGALNGSEQIGAGITLVLNVWTPQLKDAHLNAAAGDRVEVRIGWAGEVTPDEKDIEGYTVAATSETGPQAAWTLSTEGAAAAIQVPDDAAGDTTYTYILSVLVDGKAVSDPATFTLTVLPAQLASPEPIPAPPGETTQISIPWDTDRAPTEEEDVSTWTVVSESTNGPAIKWDTVTREGVTGTVTMSPSAIAGVQYDYTVTVTCDGTAVVGTPVTLRIVVGDAIAAPISIEPESVQIAPGAPAVTITALQDGAVASDGWWSLEIGAPKGTTLETLGVLNQEVNPIVVTTTADTPVGTYTLVYNKDTESAEMVIVIRVDDTQASLVAVKDGSDLTIERSSKVEEYLILGIPISAAQQMYVPQTLLDVLEAPDGMTLRLVDRTGQPVPTDAAVATGMVLDVLNDAQEVVERLFTVVQGDVSGTGMMTLTQLVRLAQAYTGKITLDPLFQIAGDFGRTGSITLSDLIREARLLMSFS